jgi:hypothetical protein
MSDDAVEEIAAGVDRHGVGLGGSRAIGGSGQERLRARRAGSPRQLPTLPSVADPPVPELGDAMVERGQGGLILVTSGAAVGGTANMAA